MKSRALIFPLIILFLAGQAAHAGVKITVGRNDNEHAAAAFNFNNVPSPLTNNAAEAGRFVIVDGEADANSGGLETLNDGLLPNSEDQPDANFFFNADTYGGRLRLDLAKTINLRQVDTYSWHPNSRGPQVYKLYASDGTSDVFNASPKEGIDPASCGWKLIAQVDTTAENQSDDGGQYGVSISGTDGILGKYSHLLFDIAPTEDDDINGNTFFSEIVVVDADAPAGSPGAAPNRLVLKSADGACNITINTAGAPALTKWADERLAPVLAEWYPKIVAMLPSAGFTAPNHFSVNIRPGDGVAATSGTRIVANSKWLAKAFGREGAGAFVHEMVHVVQHYQGGSPGWLVEGIADYVRWFKYEPQSHGADMAWMRRQRGFTPKYDASYRVSANFLNWVTEKYDKDIVVKLNAAMREGSYDESLWKQLTGKTAPELGAEWKQAVEAQLAAPASQTN